MAAPIPWRVNGLIGGALDTVRTANLPSFTLIDGLRT
jgi:hypothetical protein